MDMKNTIPTHRCVAISLLRVWLMTTMNVERIPKLKSRECSTMFKNRRLYNPSARTDAANKRTKDVILIVPMVTA